MNATDVTASMTCAVIVTYFPDVDFPTRAGEIARQVGAVIVVDNGTCVDRDDPLLRLASLPNVTVIRNEANRGHGAALNQGMRWAKNQGYRCALLFDQDTVPSDSMVEELGQIHRLFGQESSTTILGSNHLDVNSRKTWLRLSRIPDRSWVDSKTVQISGTLLPLALFEVLGPFRADLFIDGVDVEYSLRARSQGYRVAVSVKPLIFHQVGAKRRRRLLWRTVWPTFHSPERRFFMVRNTLCLVREYGAFDPKWALSAIGANVKALILVLLFEDWKRTRLAFAARGFIAGLRCTFDNTPVPRNSSACRARKS
jgi:rhamnosyltransferase